VFVLLFSSQIVVSQENKSEKPDAIVFTIRGTVREKYSLDPIRLVTIEVNGISSTTNSDGSFRIKAKKGDQLTARHKDFETVFLIIENDDRIIIEVEPAKAKETRSMKLKKNLDTFNSAIDSVSFYLKNDAEKSIEFVTNALEVSNSVKQSATAYELLGDIYLHWKQNDLAITNYKISLQNTESNVVKLKLAKAFENDKNYKESLDTYTSINKNELSDWQLISLYEGLGDTYLLIKDYDNSIKAYKAGLEVAQKHLITPKITDLNSKIAQAYNTEGRVDKAQHFFKNSLNLATKENKKRAVEEKIKVAEFNNSNQNYTDEIQLRKEALLDLDDIVKDSIIENESALTSQKQNYKIGNAFYLQKDYDSAVPYFEKSIKEADSRADLIVKKDATRRLSDVYKNSGNYEEALKAFIAYTEIVDELYIKKEQEITQASRFRVNLREKQSRIVSLESDRKLSLSITEERNKRQQLIIYFLIGGLVLLLITGYLMYKYIKQQRFANNLLALKSLRSQMNPLFIFNALNSVNSFIALNDERTANKYLSDFSHLMRAVLENSEEDFIPLQKEIELLERYTKLEHFRFQDKFDYSITIDDAINVEEFQIPPMLLQPYIENAVWHGLRYKTKKGHLNILITQKSKN
jgi:tetratricopeptide (TPR) repeat protein